MHNFTSVSRLLMVILYLAGLFCLAGCMNMEPFLHSHRTQFSNGLGNIQFYVSEKVKLERVSMTPPQHTVTAGHKIRFEKGKYIETIFLEKSTRGALAKQIDDTTLAIIFEKADDGKSRYLLFRAKTATPNMRYFLVTSAKDYIKYNSGEFTEPELKGNKLIYEDNLFTVAMGYRAFLMLRSEAIQKIEEDVRTMPGVDLSDPSGRPEKRPSPEK